MKLHFSYKVFLLVITTLRHNINLSHIQRQKWINYCKNDIRTYSDCFKLIETDCDQVFDSYEFDDESFVNTFNSFFGDRDIDFATIGSQKVVIKRLAEKNNIISFLNRNELQLKDIFMDENRVGGSYFCYPNATITKFYERIPPTLKYNKLFWLLINLNVQPLIFTSFVEQDLPIPKQLEIIGFTSVIEYKGKSLVNYFSSDFKTRLKISKRLLEGLLKFTKNPLFKIYLTDLTLDNIVFEPSTDTVTFVDLDNVIINDPLTFSDNLSTHVHEKIECHGCFAYSIEDICSSLVSDVNLFAGCQLLYEDLYEDKSNGFLHSIPEIYTNLGLLKELDKCVNCRNCDRFKSATQILEIFDKILVEIK